MKTYLFYLILLIAALVLPSCKSVPIIEKNESKTVITERIITVFDTITINGENASGEALFYCDSLNRVRLKELNIAEAEKLRLRLLFDDLTQSLKINANTPPDTIYVEIPVIVADTTRTNSKSVTVPVEIIKYKYEYPSWLLILAIIGTVSISIKVYKFFKP